MVSRSTRVFLIFLAWASMAGLTYEAWKASSDLQEQAEANRPEYHLSYEHQPIGTQWLRPASFEPGDYYHTWFYNNLTIDVIWTVFLSGCLISAWFSTWRLRLMGMALLGFWWGAGFLHLVESPSNSFVVSLHAGWELSPRVDLCTPNQLAVRTWNRQSSLSHCETESFENGIWEHFCCADRRRAVVGWTEGKVYDEMKALTMESRLGVMLVWILMMVLARLAVFLPPYSEWRKKGLRCWKAQQGTFEVPDEPSTSEV